MTGLLHAPMTSEEVAKDSGDPINSSVIQYVEK